MKAKFIFVGLFIILIISSIMFFMIQKEDVPLDDYSKEVTEDLEDMPEDEKPVKIIEINLKKLNSNGCQSNILKCSKEGCVKQC